MQREVPSETDDETERSKQTILELREKLEQQTQLNKTLQQQIDELNQKNSELEKQIQRIEKTPEIKKSTSRYWTKEEHQLFLEGLEKFGKKDVRAISNYVGTRTPTQVRTHAQKYFLKLKRMKGDTEKSSKKRRYSDRRDEDSQASSDMESEETPPKRSRSSPRSAPSSSSRNRQSPSNSPPQNTPKYEPANHNPVAPNLQVNQTGYSPKSSGTNRNEFYNNNNNVYNEDKAQIQSHPPTPTPPNSNNYNIVRDPIIKDDQVSNVSSSGGIQHTPYPQQQTIKQSPQHQMSPAPQNSVVSMHPQLQQQQSIIPQNGSRTVYTFPQLFTAPRGYMEETKSLVQGLKFYFQQKQDPSLVVSLIHQTFMPQRREDEIRSMILSLSRDILESNGVDPNYVAVIKNSSPVRQVFPPQLNQQNYQTPNPQDSYGYQMGHQSTMNGDKQHQIHQQQQQQHPQQPLSNNVFQQLQPDSPLYMHRVKVFEERGLNDYQQSYGMYSDNYVETSAIHKLMSTMGNNNNSNNNNHDVNRYNNQANNSNQINYNYIAPNNNNNNSNNFTSQSNNQHVYPNQPLHQHANDKTNNHMFNYQNNIPNQVPIKTEPHTTNDQYNNSSGSSSQSMRPLQPQQIASIPHLPDEEDEELKTLHGNDSNICISIYMCMSFVINTLV
eukprot:TRINITY_DN7524_c0_g1_i4.p1 TRINITY_DN7524_c0_g1~~TRINITY_DN7524_c0_g1_i4.p1  ORF type:complete len:665 (-),score=181.31 TRINITY_DN7524_c0_g1_i4:497-2491(-)